MNEKTVYSYQYFVLSYLEDFERDYLGNEQQKTAATSKKTAAVCIKNLTNYLP
ncbi:MAG: hypothetical protein FWF51_00455 [Chitinivibrionia bacterium]|nr:hypothetical protein [Chitinivibrionia bacterium]